MTNKPVYFDEHHFSPGQRITSSGFEGTVSGDDRLLKQVINRIAGGEILL